MKIRKISIALLLIGIIMMASILSFGSQVNANSGNGIAVNINGSPLQMDQPPIIIDGRTLVPLRAIFQALGAQVQWDAASQSITATKLILSCTVTINLSIGSTDATINYGDPNSQHETLDVPPQIIDGHTYVPLRLVGEAFAENVKWDSNSQTIYLTPLTIGGP